MTPEQQDRRVLRAIQGLKEILVRLGLQEIPDLLVRPDRLVRREYKE